MPPLRSRHPYQTLPTYGRTGLRLIFIYCIFYYIYDVLLFWQGGFRSL